MARSNLRDPLDKFRWLVEIDGFTRSGFATCQTPSYSITTKDYPEGGAHLTPRNIVDSISYTPVTLTRGVTNDTSFNRWAAGVFDLVQNNYAVKNNVPEGVIGDVASAIGPGAASFIAAAPPGIAGASLVNSNSQFPFKYRRDVLIKHVNRLGQTVAIYKLYNAFPIEYKPASDFDASADDELSVESLTLSYEGFEVKYTGLSETLTSGLTGSFI